MLYLCLQRFHCAISVVFEGVSACSHPSCGVLWLSSFHSFLVQAVLWLSSFHSFLRKQFSDCQVAIHSLCKQFCDCQVAIHSLCKQFPCDVRNLLLFCGMLWACCHIWPSWSNGPPYSTRKQKPLRLSELRQQSLNRLAGGTQGWTKYCTKSEVGFLVC